MSENFLQVSSSCFVRFKGGSDVSIRRFFGWCVLCFVCLSSSQVIADFGDNDKSNLSTVSHRITDIENVLGMKSGYGFNISSPFENTIYNSGNETMLNALNEIALNFRYDAVSYRGSPNTYIATLRSLIYGSIGYGDVLDNSPTNGIYSYSRLLADSVVNTNSVFYRQLTAQEVMTNQLSQLVSLTSMGFTNVLASLAFAPYSGTYIYPDYISDYYTTNDISGYMKQYINANYFDVLKSSFIFPAQSLANYDYADAALFYSEYMGAEGYDAFFNSLFADEYRNVLFERFGNGPIIESFSNNLSKLSLNLSVEDARQLMDDTKEDVDDIVETTEEEASDSTEDSADDPDKKPGEYVPEEDDRIDIGFLDDAMTAKDDFKFEDDIFDDFKSDFRSMFSFSGSKDLEYSFSMEIGDSTIEISNKSLFSDHSSFLSSHKSDIDNFLRFIITLNLFIVVLVFANKAFKLVSEVFGS